MPRFKAGLVHLCDCDLLAGAALPTGEGPFGKRFIYPAVSGTVNGPRLTGTVRPIGADWVLTRQDGTFELDTRIVIETDDGAIIQATYRGIATHGKTWAVTVRFETGHPDYLWLSTVVAVGCGGAEPEGNGLRVRFSWYELSD